MIRRISNSLKIKSDKAPNSTCGFVKSTQRQSRVCGVYTTNRNYRCNYGNCFVEDLSSDREGDREARSFVARNYYLPTKEIHEDTYLHRYRFTSTFEALLYTRYSAETYENTRVVATAAHNRVSVSDCSRTIVRPRQFLIITCIRLESAMMPLAP